MAKIRNSLGVLVLPIPSEEMTWEQYKDKYGIDLANSLPFKDRSGHMAIDVRKITKAIYLSDSEGVWSVLPIIPALQIKVEPYIEGGDTIGYQHLIPIPDFDDGEGSIYMNYMYEIDMFDDPETPNIVKIHEI